MSCSGDEVEISNSLMLVLIMPQLNRLASFHSSFTKYGTGYKRTYKHCNYRHNHNKIPRYLLLYVSSTGTAVG